MDTGIYIFNKVEKERKPKKKTIKQLFEIKSKDKDKVLKTKQKKKNKTYKY